MLVFKLTHKADAFWKPTDKKGLQSMPNSIVGSRAFA
jgi:hypothetical protein